MVSKVNWIDTDQYAVMLAKHKEVLDFFEGITWKDLEGKLPHNMKVTYWSSINLITSYTDTIPPSSFWTRILGWTDRVTEDVFGTNLNGSIRQLATATQVHNAIKLKKSNLEMYEQGKSFVGEFPLIGQIPCPDASSKLLRDRMFNCKKAAITYLAGVLLFITKEAKVIDEYHEQLKLYTEARTAWNEEKEREAQTGFGGQIELFYKNMEPVFDSAIASLGKRDTESDRRVSLAAATFLYSQYHALLSANDALSQIKMQRTQIRELLDKLTTALYDHPKSFRDFFQQYGDVQDGMLEGYDFNHSMPPMFMHPGMMQYMGMPPMGAPRRRFR